jgi:hypothetical protein
MQSIEQYENIPLTDDLVDRVSYLAPSSSFQSNGECLVQVAIESLGVASRKMFVAKPVGGWNNGYDQAVESSAHLRDTELKVAHGNPMRSHLISVEAVIKALATWLALALAVI